MPLPSLAMSSHGRFVAFRHSEAIEVVDLLGTDPRRSLAAAQSFAFVGATLCLAEAGELRCMPLEGGRPAYTVRAEGPLRPFWGRGADAVVAGDQVLVLEPFSVVGTAVGAFPLLGRAVATVSGGRLTVGVVGRAPTLTISAPAEPIVDVAPIFGGRLVACVLPEVVMVLTSQGSLVHRIDLPAHTWHAFAIERGQLFVGAGDHVAIIDLRYGRVTTNLTLPHGAVELAVDDDGRRIAIADASEVPVVSLVTVDELMRVVAPVAQDAEQAPPVVEPIVLEPAPMWVEPAPIVEDIATLVPFALGLPASPVMIHAPRDARGFEGAAEHLTALVDLVRARAALAIAEAWHTGRISGDSPDQHPFQREVLALVGTGGAHAADQMVAARERLLVMSTDLADRVRATLAAGIDLPFVSIARDLHLSPIGAQILIAVAAPTLRGELARLYRILGNETHRPTCDEALLTSLLGTDEPRDRDEIATELDPDSTLVRHGVVQRDVRGGLEVSDVVISRLRAQPIRRTPGTLLRHADRELDALVADRVAIDAFVRELAEPRDAASPVRVVVRGRSGVGGRTVIAALAARIGRGITCIDVQQLVRPEDLAPELTRALLAHTVPVVTGLALHDRSGDERQGVLRRALHRHPGPLALRLDLDGDVPLEPGYLELVLRSLTETERQAAFASAFAEHAIDADAVLLASRYRIGPGTMVRVAQEARRRLDRTGGDPTEIVDQVARQHVAARVGASAQRVTRLATWDQVALPDDMLDSLRELIGRARHARTVFDDWGFDRRIATARGLTALFYGPPGTGKTMIAGLIARELGLELYRVDLSKVMSKWVGETEKNLGQVFDAAEDGRLMLLFDEADSLFAKRSEVRSSNDRYANLEVNYLLQRLDSFEGVAILTTNLEGSVDPAFKRRLSMRMYFPFPDEELRAQLWSAHIPPQVQTAGDLDFAELARRFPLSGGYIRNSALRAAFLAAQENTSLAQSHLERAVLLEYRELGKLADNGHME